MQFFRLCHSPSCKRNIVASIQPRCRCTSRSCSSIDTLQLHTPAHVWGSIPGALTPRNGTLTSFKTPLQLLSPNWRGESYTKKSPGPASAVIVRARCGRHHPHARFSASPHAVPGGINTSRSTIGYCSRRYRHGGHQRQRYSSVAGTVAPPLPSVNSEAQLGQNSSSSNPCGMASSSSASWGTPPGYRLLIIVVLVADRIYRPQLLLLRAALSIGKKFCDMSHIVSCRRNSCSVSLRQSCSFTPTHLLIMTVLADEQN